MHADGEYKLKINEFTFLNVRPFFDVIGMEYSNGLIVIYTMEFLKAPHAMHAFVTCTRGCKLNLPDNFFEQNKKLGIVEINYPHCNLKQCAVYVNAF